MAATALRCTLLRRLRSLPSALSTAASNRDECLPIAGLSTRQFAVNTTEDSLDRPRPASNRANGLKLSRNVENAVQWLEAQLPEGKSSNFYSQKMRDALQNGNISGAVVIMETLHRRHPEKAVLTQYSYNLLLRHLCKQQHTIPNANLSRILSILDVMISYGCVNLSSFQVAMAACSRARDLRSAKSVIERMKECKMQPDERIYGFLINCCARKNGLVGKAEHYFDEMLNEGLNPTVLVVNAMLRVYSRDVGRSKVMLDLVHRAVREFKVYPDGVTTRMVIFYLLSENNVEGAVDILRSVANISLGTDNNGPIPMERPVVNALIDACIQHGDWGQADDVISLAKSRFTLTSGDQKDVLNAEILEEQVRTRDALTKPSVWTLREQDVSQMTFQQRKAFWLTRSRHESVDRGLELLSSDRLATYRRPRMHKLSLRLEGKLRVLNEMIHAGTATAAEFNAVLTACGRDGQLTKAEDVLSKMKRYAESSPECEPSTWSYNALLNACAVSGDIHRIEDIINEFMEHDVLPDHVTLNTVLKAHVTSLLNGSGGNSSDRFDNVMQAISFYEWCTDTQKIDPDAASYYSLFRLFNVFLGGRFSGAAFRSNEDEEADDERDEQLHQWMENFIVTTCRDAPHASLDVGVFNSAFDFYYRRGNGDGSLSLFNLMQSRDFPPDDTTLGLIFATWASGRQIQVGLQLLDHLMAQRYKPSLKVLNGAISMCANSENPSGALELLRAIEASDEYEPTVQTYDGVVRAFAIAGDVSNAWSIASEMERKLGKVSVSIYNRVIEACCGAGAPERALKVLELMHDTNGIAPNVESYNLTLQAFVVAGARLNEDEEEDDEEYEEFDDEEEEDYENIDGVKEEYRAEYVAEEEVEDAEDDGERAREFRERAVWVRENVHNLLSKMHKHRKTREDETSFKHALAACSLHEDPDGVVIIFDRLITRRMGEESHVLKCELVSEDSFLAYIEACQILQDKDRLVEVSDFLRQWHIARKQPPPLSVVMELLDSLEAVGEWRHAVRLLPDLQSLFGITPSVVFFNRAMQMCNKAGEHQLVPSIFATMEDATAYRVLPDSESYIQRIYAEEQQENWTVATDFFVEMKKKCRSEDISPKQLQKIALGRYSLRQKEY